MNNESHNNADSRGDQCGHQKEEHRPAAQLSQGFWVNAGRARHQAADHQRDDNHLQQADEKLSGEAEVDDLRAAQPGISHPEADQNAGDDRGHREDDQQIGQGEALQFLRGALRLAPLLVLTQAIGVRLDVQVRFAVGRLYIFYGDLFFCHCAF